MPWTGTSATLEIAFVGFLDCQIFGLALVSPSFSFPLDQGDTWAAYTWKELSESTENKQLLP